MIRPSPQQVVSTTTTDLALIDRARQALAEALTLDDVLEIRDQAAAVAYYAARRSGAEEAEQRANELRLRAERRIGEITREMEKAPRGGAGGSKRAAEAQMPAKSEALASVGIAKEDASRFERIAAIPEAAFEREVVKPQATTRGLAKLGRKAEPRRRAPDVRVEHPGISAAMLTKRAALFRSDLERLLKKYVQRWPANAPMAALVDVLVSTAKSLGEE